MYRIVLSPKGVVLATLLHDLAGATRNSRLVLSDYELADALQLRPDTVYRALRELRGHGALTFSRGSRSASNMGYRTLRLNPGHGCGRRLLGAVSHDARHRSVARRR